MAFRRSLKRALLWGALLLLGLVLGWAVYETVTWPDVAVLATRNPGTTAFIEQYRARRRPRGQSDALRWRAVPLQAVSPPHLQPALVAAEDTEFFFRRGCSTAELKAAIHEALREGEAPRGTSAALARAKHRGTLKGPRF